MKTEETIMLGRREFTLQGVMALLAGVAITVSGCGGGSGGGNPTAPTPTANPGDEVGSITANHGHSAIITSAQLSAGNSLDLNIRGTADHEHTISLSASEIMAAAARQRVSKVSTSNDGHDHTVTFN